MCWQWHSKNHYYHARRTLIYQTHFVNAFSRKIMYEYIDKKQKPKLSQHMCMRLVTNAHNQNEIIIRRRRKKCTQIVRSNATMDNTPKIRAFFPTILMRKYTLPHVAKIFGTHMRISAHTNINTKTEKQLVWVLWCVRLSIYTTCTPYTD